MPIASSTPSSIAVSASSTTRVTDSASTTGATPKVPATTTTAVPAPSLTSNAAASATTPSTKSTSTNSTPPPIIPSRPIRPNCQPDRSDPLKELPYFLDDLRRKVYFSPNKELKVKHRTIALAFANQVKKHPEILFKCKNYEETITNFCDENDQNHYFR